MLDAFAKCRCSLCASSIIEFKNGGTVDPEAYLLALLDYGLEGNVAVDFYVPDNKVGKWYGVPWMDWNTEVASDWPGTDVTLYLTGSSSISVQACAAFGGQDAELTTLSALRAQALRGRHGTGQQLLI
jgi:hypothetical protein